MNEFIFLFVEMIDVDCVCVGVFVSWSVVERIW